MAACLAIVYFLLVFEALLRGTLGADWVFEN
jgi:hypothetical protein